MWQSITKYISIIIIVPLAAMLIVLVFTWSTAHMYQDHLSPVTNLIFYPALFKIAALSVLALAVSVFICRRSGKLRYFFVLMAIPILVVCLDNWTLIVLALPFSALVSLGAYGTIRNDVRNHSRAMDQESGTSS